MEKCSLISKERETKIEREGLYWVVVVDALTKGNRGERKGRKEDSWIH